MVATQLLLLPQNYYWIVNEVFTFWLILDNYLNSTFLEEQHSKIIDKWKDKCTGIYIGIHYIH